MGEVWKARDTRLDRTVALKVSKGPFTERFEREWCRLRSSGDGVERSAGGSVPTPAFPSKVPGRIEHRAVFPMIAFALFGQ
jgi:hypothetical protein